MMPKALLLFFLIAAVIISGANLRRLWVDGTVKGFAPETVLFVAMNNAATGCYAMSNGDLEITSLLVLLCAMNIVYYCIYRNLLREHASDG